jgi:uncharacterized protein (DUF1501 family)
MSGKTTRRRFISGAAASVLGAGLLRAENRRTKRVIHLFMVGGMSHIDTFDPKPGIRAIPTNVDGIHISEHLPLLARRMDKITLIRSMSHEQKSHGAAQHAFPFTEEITIDGWDTHTEIHARIRRPCAILDRTLSGLLDDLERRGTLSETLLVVTTEFGRSPKLNAFGGREHHPAAFTCLLAGGGFGGKLIGETSEDGMRVMGETTSPGDLHAVIAAWRGGSESAPAHEVTMG